jgi:HEAT repeats
MRIRSRTTVVAAVLVLGIAGVIFGVVHLASPREPAYQGKTLSEWIAPFCRQTAKGLDAPGGPQHFEELEPVRHAVRQIGTNAIPFLIARLNHRESALHRVTRQLSEKQPYVALRLADPNVPKIRAIRALANLGRDGRSAIPSLKGQLSDITLSEHAVYALSGMGAEGMRAMMEQYTNIPALCRHQVMLTIVSPTSIYRGEPMASSGIDENIERLVEGLSWVVQQSTSPFRLPAINRLRELRSRASSAVPTLLTVLSDPNPVARQTAIRALGEIQAQPEVVVPALTNLLNDPDLGTRMAAGFALRAFGYDVWPQAPRMIHPPPPGQTKERYF